MTSRELTSSPNLRVISRYVNEARHYEAKFLTFEAEARAPEA